MWPMYKDTNRPAGVESASCRGGSATNSAWAQNGARAVGKEVSKMRRNEYKLGFSSEFHISLKSWIVFGLGVNSKLLKECVSALMMIESSARFHAKRVEGMNLNVGLKPNGCRTTRIRRRLAVRSACQSLLHVT
ncbi:unnamed protein product [Protopolystoma xenopodis]|uniref:Uncharacterized protein n=1 Tax=Protopolystoma xenopodis TaxID=117903 RepID=A0A3S5CPZ5_9PLAT|nr:unnamed protein product [Protopolystoma xenopodis]